MEIKKLAKNALNFGINRFIEILSICVIAIGALLLISLISFSPDDPNFIFPEGTKIKNLLGFRGSFTADLFFQSFGLIALLMPFSLIISGINIFLNKKGKGKANKINFFIKRKGKIPGTHSVIFQTAKETIELKHTAKSRDLFADGAINAAKWLVKKKPGLYNMHDVLKIR